MYYDKRMKRTLQRTIEPGFSGDVKKYTREVLGVSSKLLKRLKASGGILRNGEPVFVTALLQAGDILTLHIEQGGGSANVYPRAGELHIVYEDADILVVSKQAPLPVHPSKGHVDDSLANRVTGYYASQGLSYTTRIVTRLDSGTSGLMILAKNAYAHNGLQKQLHTGGFERGYMAVAMGYLQNKQGTVDAPIARQAAATIVRVVSPEGQRAVTHYQVLLESNGYSLLQLRLETGRTHQIRVHMAHIGHPLVGDFLYGQEDARIARTALHAYYLHFVHPVSGETLTFTEDLPKELQQLLQEGI